MIRRVSLLIAVVALVTGITLASLTSQTVHAAAPASGIASQRVQLAGSGIPSWVLDAEPYVQISSDHIASLAPAARTHLSARDYQAAEASIAHYDSLSAAQRANDPSIHQQVPSPQLVGGGGGGGCQPVDAAYYVYGWYGTGIYFHFTQCYVIIGIGAFAAGSGTAWVVAAICGLSIVGNLGCSEVAGVIAAVLAAGGGILALWDGICNSSGVGVTDVITSDWGFPSC